MLKAKIIFVSSAEREVVESMRMIYASSVAQALEMAKEIVGKQKCSVTVIPDGVSVMVEKQ